jgi:hypothetical protein
MEGGRGESVAGFQPKGDAIVLLLFPAASCVLVFSPGFSSKDDGNCPMGIAKADKLVVISAVYYSPCARLSCF